MVDELASTAGEPSPDATRFDGAARAAQPPVIEGGHLPGASSGVPVPTWVRNWLIALSIVVGLQVLLTCGTMAVAGLAAGSLPFAVDDSFMSSEDVAQQFTYLVQDGDVDGYLELYRDDDASVDRDRVRADFEKVLSSIDTSAGVDYSADQVVRFTDKETGEQILRIDLAAYNWNTGNPIGRGVTLWALEEELPDVVLTGRKSRELDGGEYVW